MAEAVPTLPLAIDTSPRGRRIVTPEGVELSVELADRGARLGALLIDACLVFGFVVVLFIIAAILFISSSNTIFLEVTLLCFFLLRVFYFPATELMWRGRTIGKRLVKIRVIDRNGGPLRADAIIMRNLLREIEIWLPLTVMLFTNPRTTSDALILLFLGGWLLALLSVPLFNKDAMRIGDMLAGTWVIVDPAAKLLPDLAAAPAAGGQAPTSTTPTSTTPTSTTPTSRVPQTAPAAAEKVEPSGSPFVFTKAQLDVYGEFELETLASVLRDRGPKAEEAIPAVATRIREKIGWRQRTGETDRAFLEAYYRGLRGNLETRAQWGRRRRDKHDKGPGRPD